VGSYRDTVAITLDGDDTITGFQVVHPTAAIARVVAWLSESIGAPVDCGTAVVVREPATIECQVSRDDGSQRVAVDIDAAGAVSAWREIAAR
jgi:hypothetical protein